jgi:hydrogenase-4 component B
VAFLVGAVAICGLPPLNGFVSEWLIYLGSFRSLAAARSGDAFAASMGAPALAFIGALAVACFVKAFSVVFLGNSRGQYRGDDPGGASIAMKWAMGLLVVACFAIGLLPRAAGEVSRRAAQALLASVQPPLDAALPQLGMATLLLLVVVGSFGVAALLLSPRRAVTFTWDCGYAAPTARMQYTASSFAQLLGRMFRRVLLPEVHRSSIGSFFPQTPDRFESHVPDPVLDRLLLPAIAHGQRGFGLARAIQTGHVQVYLAYVVVTLVALLAWSSIW